MTVASGLDSMVVGESEIAGQVRESAKTARQQGQSTAELNRLFQAASVTSKKVTSLTGLGTAGRSITHTGLIIVEQRHGSLSGKRALIVGTGAHARVVVAALKRSGVKNIRVFSSSGRAEEFAEKYNLDSVASENLTAEIAQADVVVACSGTGTPILTLELLTAARSTIGLLPIVDVALPGDVSEDARSSSLIDLISLETIREHAPSEHEDSLLNAQAIVEQASLDFELDQSARTVEPVVAAVRAHAAQVIAAEVDRVRRRSGDELAEQVQRSLSRVTNALLHTPSVQARTLARSGSQDDYRRAIEILFGIELHPRENE
jgi:glutamyl-tRNA reductase